jgi:hypothetical protein
MCLACASTSSQQQDSNSTTHDLFTEIAVIHRTVLKDSVSISISPAQWKLFWKIVNEETSSFESGIHFGHYIAGCKLDIVLHYHTACVIVVLAHAIELEQWSRGLSVMLEKTLGNTLVMKLLAILLMEADFNATNKIVHGNQMLHSARDYNLMPEEVFSERTRILRSRGCVKGMGQHPQDGSSLAFAFSTPTARKNMVQNLCTQSPNWKNTYPLSSTWMAQIYCILTSHKMRQSMRCTWPSRRVSTAREIS